MLYRLIRFFRLPHVQHLYVLFDPAAIPWRCKTGISCDGDIRKGQVECSIRERVGQKVKFRHVKLPVLYARQNERLIHWLFRRFRWNGFSETNGGGEYFWSINFLTFALVWLWLWQRGVDLAHWKAALILVLPIPLDYILIVVILCVAQVVVLFAGFYGLIWFLFA